MEIPQRLTHEALWTPWATAVRSRSTAQPLGMMYAFRIRSKRLPKARRKFWNFAFASQSETYNASREGEHLSRWKGLPPARTSVRLILSPAVTPRARLCQGVLTSGDVAVPVGRDTGLGHQPRAAG